MVLSDSFLEIYVENANFLLKFEKKMFLSFDCFTASKKKNILTFKNSDIVNIKYNFV